MHVRVLAAGEHYALPVSGVREISPLGPITPVPGAPAAILGVWNLRGDVIAAVDLARLLGLESSGKQTRVVVSEDGELRVGLVVEAVTDVGDLPGPLEPADSAYLSGSVLVDREPVGVIDLAALLEGAVGGAG